ncbi:unnamed protein product, partial [Closterium sp. NIES-54]
PVSPLRAPSPYTSPTRGLAERRAPASRPASPARPACTSRRTSRPRPPAVPGTHQMALRPSTAPLRVQLPSPPASSLPTSADPESDSLRAASPAVAHFLAAVVTDPSLESTAATALVVELVDFAARCRLDYAASLVAESASVCPPSVGGECALSMDVLEDRQEEFQCFAAALPHLAAMDAEMASWKSTGTYDDEVPPSGANIVSGMWIFRVKRPPGSPPVFKARYVARGFSLRQGVDYFQTFSPTPKMTTLRVLLHVATQRDYELHSLDFSTAFLQGSLHEEIWLRRPPGFTGSFPPGTQWSLRRPVYGLRQAPRHADASWADDQTTQRSSQGYTFSLGSGSVSWRSTRLSSVLSSSCEAEIYAGAMAAQELRWLTYLLTDLGEQPRSPPVLYVDNKAMLALCREHKLEHRTKHIALRYFLARELQQRGLLRLAYVASEANTADIFTKALAPGDHQRFCTMLDCVVFLLSLPSPASSWQLPHMPLSLLHPSSLPQPVVVDSRGVAARSAGSGDVDGQSVGSMGAGSRGASFVSHKSLVPQWPQRLLQKLLPQQLSSPPVSTLRLLGLSYHSSPLVHCPTFHPLDLSPSCLSPRSHLSPLLPLEPTNDSHTWRSTGDPRLILGKGYRHVGLGGYGRTHPLQKQALLSQWLVAGILTWHPSKGLGFESQCVHFGHPSAGGCQRSTGDPRLILGKGYRHIGMGGYGLLDR